MRKKLISFHIGEHKDTIGPEDFRFNLQIYLNFNFNKSENTANTAIDNTKPTLYCLHIIISESVQIIKNYTFSSYNDLPISIERVTLPENLRCIGIKAFINTNIKEITIPSKVYFIGAECFYNSKKLKKVIFKNLNHDIYKEMIESKKENKINYDREIINIMRYSSNIFNKDYSYFVFTDAKQINMDIEYDMQNIPYYGYKAFGNCNNLNVVEYPLYLNNYLLQAFPDLSKVFNNYNCIDHNIST